MSSTQIGSIKPQRHSLEARLLTAISDLKGAQLDHRTACLLHAQAPDDQERAHAVTVLELEVNGHQLTIDRLTAAQQAEDTGAVQQAAADRIATARAAAKIVAELAPRERAIAERLADKFDGIGADLAELAAVQRERKTQTWSAVSNAAGPGRAERHTAVYNNLISANHSRVALLAAIVRSGLGRVGPDLAPYFTVSAHANGTGTVEAALERFDKNAGHINEFIAELLEKAASPQPATTED